MIRDFMRRKVGESFILGPTPVGLNFHLASRDFDRRLYNAHWAAEETRNGRGIFVMTSDSKERVLSSFFDQNVDPFKIEIVDASSDPATCYQAFKEQMDSESGRVSVLMDDVGVWRSRSSQKWYNEFSSLAQMYEGRVLFSNVIFQLQDEEPHQTVEKRIPLVCRFAATRISWSKWESDVLTIGIDKDRNRADGVAMRFLQDEYAEWRSV